MQIEYLLPNNMYRNFYEKTKRSYYHQDIMVARGR